MNAEVYKRRNDALHRMRDLVPSGITPDRVRVHAADVADGWTAHLLSRHFLALETHTDPKIGRGRIQLYAGDIHCGDFNMDGDRLP